MFSQPASSTEPKRLPYLPGLDGLRAIAVLAVLIYHANLPLPGGFLGVEVFFVISGFLITALLRVEWQQNQTIDLGAFWIRRARRLLPALIFLLLGTLLIAGFALRGERSGIGTDVLAALGYVMNWHLILSGQSYFDPLLRPPLLQHLWSLAVEEQFYLVWPLLFFAGMRWLRASRLLGVTLITALGSTLLMAWLYQPGADPSRIYYGTDTRAAGLLLGAALAMVWTPGRIPAASQRSIGRLLDIAGLLSLGGLIACFAWLPSQNPWLYHGGFAFVATLTAIVIAAVTHPATRLLPSLLGWSPLRNIGLRSYGIYLWHWPIFMVTRPYVDVQITGLPLLVLRIAIVAILVEISYRFVELPFRRRSRPWSSFRASQRAQPRFRLPKSSQRRVAVIGILCLLAPSLLLLSPSVGAPARQVDGRSAAGASIDQAGVPSPTPAATALPNRSTQATAAAAGDPAPTAVVATPVPTTVQPLDPALIAQLQSLLDDTVADGFIPGASLSISIPGYEPWSGTSGSANPALGTPMQPDTLMHIASITKMFTAVVVLQLVEEGRLNLDTPITVLLPNVDSFSDATTVRHLLSHTSGIFDYLEDPQFYLQAYAEPERTWAPEELIGMVDQYGQAFDPGERGQWKYASTNYVLLGMIVEQVTGRSLAQEMRERIMDPLGLDQTFFAPDEPLQGVEARGHIGASDRADVSMSFVFATGNLVSTPDDLRQFMEALFSDRLLTPAARALMTSVVDTGGAYDMPELQYGLGIMQANLNVGPAPTGAPRDPTLSTVFGHIGGIAGFRSAVWRVPDSGITIALSMNQADVDPNLLARDTLDTILTWQGH